MLSNTYTITHYGGQPQVIRIETDLSAGLPGVTLVGLASKSIEEARERIRGAIKNSGLSFPSRKIVINLSPAHAPKHGTSFDLGMAIGILQASKQIPSVGQDVCFAAELALNGDLLAANDSIASILTARDLGFKTIVIAQEAPSVPRELLENVEVLRANNLEEVYQWLTTAFKLSANKPTLTNRQKDTNFVDFSTIRGLEQAKRAMIIAAAGGHNILMSGPPGSGKTLLANALPGILPPLSLAEAKEVAYLHDLHPSTQLRERYIFDRPFRSPHHTASTVALVGGGTQPRPGEASLAHRGVLFLDELAEYSRGNLESLRQPIEDRKILIARAQNTFTYPAAFLLVGATNPCPCGFYGSQQKSCDCSAALIAKYRSRLSGPLLDRFDLQCTIREPSLQSPYDTPEPTPSSRQLRSLIVAARKRQSERYAQCGVATNSEVPAQYIQQFCEVSPDAATLIEHALARYSLTQRSITRSIKVARTIADLVGTKTIQAEHIAEALQFRTASESQPNLISEVSHSSTCV